jgi:hypothetical protein
LKRVVLEPNAAIGLIDTIVVLEQRTITRR